MDEFTNPINVKMWCGTFNLHAQSCVHDCSNLEEWLFPDGTTDTDLYAISFQEIVKLNAVNVTVDLKGETVCTAWENAVLSCLNSKHTLSNQFVLVASKQLVGAFLCVFLRENLMPHCCDVRTASTATGVMDMLGNKGGVVVRLQLFHRFIHIFHACAKPISFLSYSCVSSCFSTICFVGGHLAAKRDNVAGRNSDFNSIMEKTCLFPDPDETNRARIRPSLDERPLLLQRSDNLRAPYVRIQDHDIVFWIGDLNYRIESSVSLEEVLSKCAENDISFLCEHDQLLIEKKAGRSFLGYEEGAITFLPTYKFIPGSDVYDNRPDKKLRPPAYCDRVLWNVRRPIDSSLFIEKLSEIENVVVDTSDVVDADSNTLGLIKVAQELRSPREVLISEAGYNQENSLVFGKHYVRQLCYKRSLTPRISDHKPVSALFDCGLRKLDKKTELKVFMELLKVLDHMENAGVPKLDVKGLDINAGRVNFKVIIDPQLKLLFF